MRAIFHFVVRAWLGMWLAHFGISLRAQETFRVATFNLENYINAAAGTRPVKTAEAKVKVRESIRALHCDVLAIQEIGGTNALLELRATLTNEGTDFRYWELVTGHDPHVQVAVLSKFPIVASRSHTNEGFLLRGRRHWVSRGFAEVEIQVNSHYRFTLFTAHLKSKRPVPEADESELREEEARLLRAKIEARLNLAPDANLIVVGDLNDVPDARSTKTVIGKGRTALIDTRPAERNGDDQPNANPRFAPRNVTWTYFYGKEDTYSRIDYILISRGMAREWLSHETHILTIPNWGVASDHRPLVASFVTKDK